ncbi:indolepyruvate oxidoreductase subunit IorA [Desulfosarcina ovata subsp. sediminis]|uniref:Indolepyruvate oxidoreductase subunit IorA n=1 Tax=Desulfosarcina ovata subsp. sediminis TaxID=885957 RepID=A0A5K7ZJH0_9BACT|nr:indolepyruvate ferredoxin oxidoreductase subunit alpha [Desulfosarcina ovata]BBO81146.1 indolepyruvate oxidoreductase subunit IorA [Desulfosarcina ovata subsp. sediminis]
MRKQILSGNEAVALGAYQAGVKVASAYPGTPSTEILQNFATYDGVYAEWAPNEKVALEVAIGSAMTGVRTLFTAKHVGINVAADPLMTLAYTGIPGGLLMVCADDPGMHSSQNEQDNRFYARFAKIPMLEPADSQEAKAMVAEGLRLSEAFDTPTLLRMTTRVCHSKGIVGVDADASINVPVAEGFKRDLKKFVMIPAFAKLRHPLVLEREAKLAEVTETSAFNRIEMNDPAVGVITSGIAYQYVKEILPDASVLKIGMTFPLPRKMIAAFAAKVDRLFVVEELEPYIEDEIRIMGLAVEGKAFFPRLDELSPDVVAAGFAKAGVLPYDLPPAAQKAPGSEMPRPPLLCAGCPHRGLFFALNKMKAIVHSDIGCYTLSVLPPLQSIDSTLCMGASISMAHGTAKAMAQAKIEDKRPVFAAIGDSTFFHSGITSLLDVIYNRGNVNVIVLDNRITAMTGGQQNPGTGRTLQMEETVAVDIIELVKALGVKRAREIDPFDLEGTLAALKEEVDYDGPSVLVTKRPCIQLFRQDPQAVRIVDEAACIGCKMCLKLGCPSISQGGIIPDDEGKKERRYARIDAATCYGCTLCEQICKQDAISVMAG